MLDDTNDRVDYRTRQLLKWQDVKGRTLGVVQASPV